MKIKSVLLCSALLIFSSCSSGPTLEQKARWARQEKDAQDNTKAIAKFIVDEVWKVPVKELRKKGTRYKSPGSGYHKPFWILKSKQKVKKELNNPYYLQKYKTACNPDIADPPIAVSLLFGKEQLTKKDVQMSLRLGYYLTADREERGKWLKKERKSLKVLWKCAPGAKYSSLRNQNVLDPSVNGIDTLTLSGREIVLELKRQGFPIDTNACKETKSGDYDKYKTYTCSFDLDPYIASNQRPTSELILVPNLTIRTEYKSLKEFYISHMVLTKEEERLSLQQIYEQRFADPDYGQKMVQYKNAGVEQTAYYNNKRARKDHAQAAAANRRRNARHAREKAEMNRAWSKSPVGMSDSQFEANISKTYNNTMKNINGSRTKKRTVRVVPKKRSTIRYNKSQPKTSNIASKRSFSPSYNKKEIAKKFPGRTNVVKGSSKPGKVDISRIACVSPYASPVVGIHGFYMLKGGSIAAGGPYCEHFSPRKGIRDCSGHKKRHAEDFKLSGKETLRKIKEWNDIHKHLIYRM